MKFRVINLTRTPERWTRFVEQNPGIPAERWAAVDGAKLDRQVCIKDGIITAANEFTPGALGVAMSHLTLWRECTAGSEPYHIAEDDVVFRKDLPSMAQSVLEGLKHWDIVLWGHNLDWPVQVSLAPGTGVTAVQYDHEALALDRFQAARVVPMLAPLISAAGLLCYSISPQGAAHILSQCLPVGNEVATYLVKIKDRHWLNSGIDVELSRHYARLRAFIALPLLAVGKNDQTASTIRGHLAAIHDYRIANRAPSGRS